MNMENNPDFNNYNNQLRMSRRTPYNDRNRNEMNAYNELLSRLREQNDILKRQLLEVEKSKKYICHIIYVV